MGQKQSRGNLRQALMRLRRSLGDVLRLDGEEVGLTPARVVSDVLRFEACAAEGTPDAIAEAVRLYRGDFLAGLSLQEPPFEEWLLAQRERLCERALEAVARLLAHHRQAGRLEAALQSGLQLLTLDPLQELVHRTLMRLYVQLGRRGAALRQYQVCTAVLERELRAQPEPETKVLYRQILTERPAVSPLIGDGVGAPTAEMAPAWSSPPAEAAVALPSSKGLDALAADLPLVGREIELTGLIGLLDAAWSGHPRRGAARARDRPRLRGVVDRARGRRGRFVLLGSASPALMRHISESLAGRTAFLVMLTGAGRRRGAVSRRRRAADRSRVIRLLRFGDDQLAADELERFSLEHAERDEPLGLGPPPAPECQRYLRRHRGTA